MTEPTDRPPAEQRAGDPAPVGRPPLDRAPSERYVSGQEARERIGGSPSRGIAYGIGVAIAGAASVVLLVGILSVQTGLLIVAFLIGRFMGPALRAGGGRTIAGDRLRLAATALALAGVLAGQLASWLYAVAEGGALGPLDYLAETLGLLVPAQLVIAGVTAWWTAR